MAKISGHGAEVIVCDAESDSLLGTAANTNFEIEVSVRIDEATDSEDNAEAGEPIINKVDSWTIEQIDKDDTSPELVGLELSTKVNVYFRRGGNSNNFDWIQNTIVKSIRITNPQTGLRRLVITGEYGEYTPNTPIS